MIDGEHLSFAGHEWEVIVGRGHSPEHACLYDEERNILISGDQILPTISPNVSVWPTEPLANPLKDWFASLEKLKARMPEDVLVLPAHGKPFRGAHRRLDELAKEHMDRLDTLLDICTKPLRAVDMFESLYSSRINDSNRIMATGEALAHLHYLCESGQLHVESNKDGVNYYRRT